LESSTAAAGNGSNSSSSSSSDGGGGGGAAAALCGAADLQKLNSSTIFALALSLLMMSPADWGAARQGMLLLTVRHAGARAPGRAAAAAAAAQSAGGSSTASGASISSPHQQGAAPVTQLDDEQLYVAVAPMLRLYGLVSWLQDWAKQPACKAAVNNGSLHGSSSSRGDDSSHGSSADWSLSMAAKLQDLPACSEAAKQLLEYTERAERALGLHDLLEGLDLLPLVVQMNGAGHADACQDFVRTAYAL
jgi:hypothetical protein